MELSEVAFHFVHYVQGRSIRALRHRDVDCPASIDFGVAGDDVARIFHRAHIAQKHSGTCSGPDGQVLQILDIRNNGIDWRQPQ